MAYYEFAFSVFTFWKRRSGSSSDLDGKVDERLLCASYRVFQEVEGGFAVGEKFFWEGQESCRLSGTRTWYRA